MTDTFKQLALGKPSLDEEAVEVKQETPEGNVADGDSTETPEQPTELEALTKDYANLEKRFKDTQIFAQKNYQAVLKNLNDKKEAGDIDDETYASTIAELKSSDISMAENPLTEIAKQFDAEKRLVAGVMGLADDKAEAAIQAFNRTLSMDKSIETQLMNIPEHQRTKWILEQGGQMLDNVELIDEYGGVLGAIKHLKSSQPDMEALKKELTEQIMAELNNKTKPSMSGLSGGTDATGVAPTSAKSFKRLAFG